MVMVEVCIPAKWTCNVISACFPTLAHWRLIWEFQIFLVQPVWQSGEAISPASTHLTQQTWVGAAGVGNVEGFGHHFPTLHSQAAWGALESVGLARLNHIPQVPLPQ